jgi:hypothetical protein
MPSTGVKSKKQIENLLGRNMNQNALQSEFLNNHKKDPRYIFKVSNKDEFNQIGKSFMHDFENGKKNFAFTSTGYKQAQQRTVLALASFFDHNLPLKIAIISDQLENGIFEELVRNSDNATTGNNINLKRFYHHFDFITFDTILKLSSNENALSELSNSYDLILWDIPDLDRVKNKTDIYLPIMNLFDSLTVIVSQNIASQKEMHELRKYFMNYGVGVKDLVLDYATQK